MTKIDLSQKACVVLDHGFFVELALKLSEKFGRVYYVDPSHEEAMAKIDHAVIGDGFAEIQRVEEIWDVIDHVDLCVFPDVHHGAMQEHIARMGIPVWGGRRACELELKKLRFRQMQRMLGMNVPEFKVIEGLEALRAFCRENEDYWIKTSPQFRGNRETFHHENYLSSRDTLDQMGVDFGVLQDAVKFVAEQSIKAPFEGGLDTYCVDGRHPSQVLQAYEIKDKCCIGAVQNYTEVPTEITSITDEMWPVLAEYKARQFTSYEVKITNEHKSYLLEPTIRMASPAGEPQLELYDNLAEIIYGGANGQLVEPQCGAKFYCQAMLDHSGDPKRWRSVLVPASVRRWVKLYHACQVGDRIGLSPGDKTVGSVLGIGDTPTEALEHLKDNLSALKDEPVCAHIEALAEAINEINEAEEEGIHFSSYRMPEPAQVLDPA